MRSDHGAFACTDLEVGFDVVEIHINSQLIDTISGLGRNWVGDDSEFEPQFIRYLDADYVERHGNAVEVCLKVVTDSNIKKGGFRSRLSVEFVDPEVVEWSEWTECATLTPKQSSGA